MLTRDALISCLPPAAYDRSAPSVVAEAHAVAVVLDDVISATEEVLREHQPDKAAEALTDWERNYSLPDSCVGGSEATEATRRSNLLERMGARGNLSRAYMLSIAERLGYPGCTITEFGPMTCEDPCDSHVNGPEFIGLWRLNAPMLTAIVVMTCESPCDSPLQSWGNTQLECVINRRKPSHTRAIFAYTP